MMKYLFILLITFISSAALAAPGSHSPLTTDNPHAKGACASQKGKVSQFQRFHGKDWKNARSEAKNDNKPVKKVTNLKNYI